jgi:hypothetical protein
MRGFRVEKRAGRKSGRLTKKHVDKTTPEA